ncbi:MAG: YitT family protein [Bacteroidaceae bacterium]|nr:YitT family protein [Bacteroidaceae bacterium]MBQ2460420.1 YitT family protein [Bacteroidaceae bacterium]MBQ2519633.1 YitT family protein [Bacteroidaceae bacterium]MBQ3957332.1 YitT family protein [Bacteroidaceae bacterium]MBQ3991634.1 YitT family protein [Bacteroidaceae bacterium]
MNKIVKFIFGDTSPWQMTKDYAQMTAGLFVYAVGYSCFLLPYQIISGGVSGISTLVFYSTGIHANLTYFFINLFLLVLAARIMGRRYFVRTIYGIFFASLLIGIFQNALTNVTPEGKEILTCIVGEQKFMAVVIGGLLEGLGLAIVFMSGGSTGGTDIIASCVNKYWNISLGRMLLFLDIFIIGCGYILSHSIELTVFGYVTMFISNNFLDYVINGARQSVQFIIISKEHEKIADEVGRRLERGVTILYGEGWYSKEQRKVLLILAKKYESRHLFRLIRETDPNAFVSMSNVEGVFGEGFDIIKKG